MAWIDLQFAHAHAFTTSQVKGVMFFKTICSPLNPHGCIPNPNGGLCLLYPCRRVLSWCQSLSWTTTSPSPATTWLRCWMSTRQLPTRMWSWLVGHRDKHTLYSDTRFSAAQYMSWGSRSTLAQQKIAWDVWVHTRNTVLLCCKQSAKHCRSSRYALHLFRKSSLQATQSSICWAAVSGPLEDISYMMRDTPCSHTGVLASGIAEMLWYTLCCEKTLRISNMYQS